ncbi:MAG: TonB-dependent receptor domain-containing protein [Geminicoccaceae bacterium]
MSGRARRCPWPTALVTLSAALLAPVLPADAQEPACERPIAQVPAIEGRVFRLDGSNRYPLARGDQLCPGQVILTGSESRVAFALQPAGTVLRVDQNSQVALHAGEDESAPSLLELLRGAIYFLARQPRQLSVETPFVNAGIEGTEVLISVTPAGERWLVLEGALEAMTPDGPVALGDGARLEVTPDAVRAIEPDATAPAFGAFASAELDWTLFYPPVLLIDADTAPAVAAAASALAAGQPGQARASLAAVPDDGPDAAAKQALLAIIDVAGNRPAAALARLDVLDAGMPPVAIARSYALQADGRLDAARMSVQASLDAHDGPAAPLLQARLAELELAFGNIAGARDLAREAEAAGGVALGAIVTGFAALADYRATQAQTAFERAIALDDQDPLAWLGYGLARFRQGDVAAGEQALELASALDPNRALLRSYLGKAYADAFRDDKAATQLAIAKLLDPADPTAWYYDALRLADANRPVEALANLDAASARNDNREVTRSRLLLDQDRAIRSVTGARIFRQLTLEQRGAADAGVAILDDPTSESAHQFLAESYEGRSGLEFSRASAAYRATLAAPPRQHLPDADGSLTDLNIAPMAHALTPGLLEGTRYFETEGAQVGLDIFAGTQATFGERAGLSILAGPGSGGIGQLYSETDGWRVNNDIRNRALRGQLKLYVEPRLQLTLDAFTRDTEQGYLPFDFDPDPNDRVVFNDAFASAEFVDLRDRFRQHIEESAVTASARIAPRPRDELLLAVTHGRERDSQLEVDDFTVSFAGDPLPFINERAETDTRVATKGEIVEGHYSHDAAGWQIQVGGLLQDATQEVERTVTRTDLTTGEVLPPATQPVEEDPLDQSVGYVYGDVALMPDLTATAGFSYERLDFGDGSRHSLNPKVGMVWQPLADLRLRAAAYRTFSRASLVVNRTLEPVTIAGFPQFFDDGFGSAGEVYALGVDGRIGAHWLAGANALFRRYDQPLFEDDEIVRFDPFREDIISGYVGYLPARGWVLSVSPAFSQVFTTDQAADGIFGPSTLKTVNVPLRARYFARQRWFAGLSATFVHQDVERSENQSADRSGSEHFWLFGAEAGYRLPRNRGALQLDINNIFGETFRYQDDNYRTTETRSPRYIPETSAILRLTLTLP